MYIICCSEYLLTLKRSFEKLGSNVNTEQSESPSVGLFVLALL